MGIDRAAGPPPPPVRCDCGRQPGDDDRFCAGCGRPVDADGTGEGAGLALLIDDRRSRDPGPTLTAVQTRFPTRAVLSTAAAVLGLLLVWSLFQGSDEIAPDRRGDGLLGAEGGAADDQIDDAADDQADGAADDQADDAVNGAADVARDDALDGAGSTTAGGPTTTGAGNGGNPATTSTGSEAGSTPGDGLLLGEATGLTLITGQASGGQVQLLDLDTGLLQELEGQRGAPVGTIGSSLVLRQISSIRIVELGDPDFEAIQLSGPELPGGFWAEFAGIADDLVLVYQQNPSENEGRLVAYDTEGVVQESNDLSDGLGWYPWGFQGDLVYHPAGGVYERDGDDFVRRSDGMLVAVGDELVLVYECDAAMTCRSRWFDKTTWDEADLPEPAIGSDGQASIIGSDRWLREVDWRDGVNRLYEVATGALRRETELRDQEAFSPGFVSPMSDDGRWLVDRQTTAGGDGVVVVDLDRGTEWPIPVQLAGEWGAVFVESALLDPDGS